MAAVNLLKAILVKLYNERLSRGALEMNTQETFQEERMSLIYQIKKRARLEQWTIANLQDMVSGTQAMIEGIVEAFNSFLRQKYGPITVDNDCVRRLEEASHRLLTDEWKKTLHIPITSDELQGSVNKGGGNKAFGKTV